MEWDGEAVEALRRVPVFVRPLVRRRVEEFARQRGELRISGPLLADARRQLGPAGNGSRAEPDAAEIERLEREALAAQEARYRHRCYEVQVCAGAVGCPRALVPVGEIADDLVATIEGSGSAEFVSEGRAGRPILSHHRFKAAVSGCPNACSQPQIRDLGVIGRIEVGVAPGLCNRCGECLRSCREDAITLTDESPVIDRARCIGCADCVRVCAPEALQAGRAGCRIMAGGKLGRHPQLAREIAPFVEVAQVTPLLGRVLEIVMNEGEPGERLAEILARTGEAGFVSRPGPA
jgi:anaerobic sulfite reductase subunit C